MLANFCNSGTSCDSITNIIFVVCILVALVSAFMVHGNESEEIKKKPLLRELLGGIDVFFTNRLLNGKGRKWRIPYLISILYLVFWFIFLS